MNSPTKLYRAEQRTYASMVDDYENYALSYDVEILEFEVIKITEKGYWIDYYRAKKWVAKDSVRKFANVSKEGALNDFIHRKNRQLRIMTSQMRGIEFAMSAAQDKIIKIQRENGIVPTHPQFFAR